MELKMSASLKWFPCTSNSLKKNSGLECQKLLKLCQRCCKSLGQMLWKEMPLRNHSGQPKLVFLNSPETTFMPV